MELSEFKALGFLQEANRAFFNPLGIRLIIEDNTLKVEDHREAPEKLTIEKIDKKQMMYMELLWKENAVKRQEALGYVIQKTGG